MSGKKLRHREVGMPKSSLVESPAPSSLPCLYPDDLDPAVQTELVALADIERHYEKLCARLNGWTGPQSIRERILRGLERDREEKRRPHVLRLGELHQQMMSATMFRDTRSVH